MEKIKLRILQIIENVHKAAKGSKLDDALFEKVDADLEELSKYLEVSKMQAFFLANVFLLNYKGDTVDLNDLVKYFDCNPLRLLEFSDDFDVMYSKRILLKHASRNRTRIIFRKGQFIINEKITEAICHNLPMPKLVKKNFGNVVDLLEELNQLEKRREDDEISVRELLNQTKSILESNQQFQLIRKVQKMSLKIADAYFFFQIVWQTVTGFEKTWLGFPVGSFFEKTSDWMNYVQAIIHDENELVKRKLIEIEKADFFIDIKMKLTDYSLNLLKEEGITLYPNR